MKYNAIVSVGLVAFILLSLLNIASATIVKVSAPSTVFLGRDINVTAVTADQQSVTFILYNTTGNEVNRSTLTINGTGYNTFSNSLISVLGNWSVLVTSGNQSFTIFFSVIEPYYIDIIPLESLPHDANRVIKISTPNSWVTGANFQIADTNVTKSGTIYYGNINESLFNCDLNGDSILNSTLYVWISDLNTAGNYDTVFMDDDNNITQTPDTTRKVFLTKGSTTVKCSNYSDIAPYKIALVYSGGVYLILQPGTGDQPYQPDVEIAGTVLSYNLSNYPKAINITKFILRYKELNQTWTEASFNPYLIDMNVTPLDNQTGADGFSNIISFNTTSLINLQGFISEGYTLIVNDVSTNTFRIIPSWTATVLIGDPITRTEKYDFNLNDPVAVGITTDVPSSNLSISVNVYTPNRILRANWSYSSGTGNGIFYDNNTARYIAGMTRSYSPLLTVNEIGEWAVETTVTSGTDKRYFENIFNVKSFEVSLFTINPPSEDRKLIFNQLWPGGPGFIGIFAFKFGKRGDLEKNFEMDDVIVLDSNVTDNINTCNTSVLSLIITDIDGNTIADHPNNWSIITDLDNAKKIMDTYGQGKQPPQVFLGQCMIYMQNVSLPTGEYAITAIVNSNNSNSTDSIVFHVRDIDTHAEPWDLQSNNYRRFFSPGSNVTFKVFTDNLYTRTSVAPEDIVDIDLLEVFNPDYGGPVTDLIDGFGYNIHTVSGENITMFWVDLSNRTSGFHIVRYRIKAQINASSGITNITSEGSGEVETKMYDIEGHPDFTRDTEYYRPDEDITFIVDVFGPEGPASGVYVYIENVVLFGKRDIQINFTAARATTGSNGRANVTIRPTTGNWLTGGYDVRIRVKDSEGNIDYGNGWFDVKTYQVYVIPVDVQNNTCSVKSLMAEEKEDAMEKFGLKLTNDQKFAVIGRGESGLSLVTPLQSMSTLFQITNLNGEPVFADTVPVMSNISNCTLAEFNAPAKYFTLSTEGLEGQYELEVVTEDSNGTLGMGDIMFFVAPFYLDVSLYVRGEPVFSPGDPIKFGVETTEDANVTNLELIRLIRISGAEELIPGAAGAINGTINWLTPVNWSRQFTIVIPSNISGIRKGEYIIQMQFTITEPGNVQRSLVHNQFIMIRPFTYSLARTMESWADSFNTTESFQFSYWDENQGSYYYGEWRGGCPFPVINSSLECGLVNKTAIRVRVLEIWPECQNCLQEFNRFISYYNISGDINLFQGYNLIVGPVSFESVSSAKVYVVKQDSDLFNDSLVGLSVGDIITDDSGIQFRISQIKQNEVILKPFSFVKVWRLRNLLFNLTNKSLSGVVRIGTIPEERVRIDFNGDGNFTEMDFGLPFIIYDPNTRNIFDTARIDSNMNLNFDDEQELSVGGTGILVNISGAANRKLYLTKADNFNIIFALNESGFDNWFGTHRKGTNITIPIYSKTQGLNLSVTRIFDGRRRTVLPTANYTAYSANIGSDGIGLLKVAINQPGQYAIQYMLQSNSTTEVPEPWESPFVEVRAFDTERDIFREVVRMPRFTRLNGTAGKLVWWESRGYQQEWIGENGTGLEIMLNTLPAGFSSGFTTAEYRCPYMQHECSSNTGIYILYDRTNDTAHIRNSTDINFTNVIGRRIGQVAYTRTQRWPDPGDPDDTVRDINFSLVGKRCWSDGCQLVIEERQPILTLNDYVTPTGLGGPPCHLTSAGELCAFGSRLPRNQDPLYMWINKTDTNETLIFIFTNVTNFQEPPDLSLPHATIAINSSGEPNTTSVITVYGKRFIEDWCSNWPTGCVGGQYLAHIRIINSTWGEYVGPGNYAYRIWYMIDETYNNSDYWVSTAINSSIVLVGPSNNYLLRNIEWKGIWAAIDINNMSNPRIYISTDTNFSGETAYSVGDTIYMYDRWLDDTIPFQILSLTPRNYGPYILTLGQNVSPGTKLVWVEEVNQTANKTRFNQMDTSCEGCSVGNANDCFLNEPSCSMGDLSFTFNSIINSTSVNATLTVTSGAAKWGYNTDALNPAINATFYNHSYQKQVGKITINNITYTVVTLDTNSSDNYADFTRAIISNDTSLSSNEVRDLGNTTPIVGDYYLSWIQNDRIVLISNILNIIGIPYSADNLGYYYSVAQPTAFSGDMANNSNNYTSIMYAEERWDEPSALGRLIADDDSYIGRFDNDRTQVNDTILCYDKNPLTNRIVNESGRICEAEGNIGQWYHIDFNVRNDSTGLFYDRMWYNTWDTNISDQIRWFRYFDGWWGEFLGNTSNITIGIRVRDFSGNPVRGIVNITDIYMMGEFYGEWLECSLRNDAMCSDMIRYAVSYDGATLGNISLDSDGLMFITISLQNNTAWRTGYGYEIRMVIRSEAGDSEETGIWFDLGRRERREEGESQKEACDSIINSTVCTSSTAGRCQWKIAEDKCVPMTENVYCRDYTSESDCTTPCLWIQQQSNCISCNQVDEQTTCNQIFSIGGPCMWSTEENECIKYI